MAALANAIVKKCQPKIMNFLYYAKVELVPPKPSEIPEMVKGFGKLMSGWKNGSWKRLTVKEAFLNTMVATEVVCWFYIGECIGKRGLIGYQFN